MAEIRNALSVRKHVVTHTSPINVPSYKGSGYAILDPVTGEGAYKISGGKNGGFQDFAESAVIMTAAALGFVDGRTGQYVGQKFIFADSLKYFAKMSKASAALGYVGLLVAVAKIWANDSISPASKIGQTAITLLSFGIICYVVGAIAAAGVVSFGAAATIGLMIASVFAISATLINSYYFSVRIRLWREIRYA